MRAVVVLVSVLGLTGLAACSNGAAPSAYGDAGGDVKPLNVVYASKDAQGSPAFFAEDTGLYAPNGVAPTFSFASGQNTIPALVAHQADVALTGSSQTLGPIAGGADLVTIMTISPVYNWEFYAQKGISDVAALRAKSVGVTAPGATFDVALRLALPKQGLPVDAVTYISTGSIDNVLAALLSGAVDGAPLIVGGATLKAQEAGMNKLFDFATLGMTAPVSTIVTTRTALKEKPEAIQGFVNAIMQALETMRTDKAAAIPVLKDVTGVQDQADLEYIYDYFITKVWINPPYPTKEQFETILPSVSAADPKISAVDLESVFDRSLVDQALLVHPWK